MFMQRGIKRFYRPNIISVSLSVIFFGLVLKFVHPLLGLARIVPCKVISQPPGFGLCPANFMSGPASHYLFFPALDLAYQVMYFLVVLVLLPYTLSCLVFHVYYRHIKKVLR